MTHQIKKDSEGTEPSHKHNEQKYAITNVAWRAEVSSSPGLNQIIDIIECDDSRLDQQRQAIFWLYQLILEVYLADTLIFLEPSDEIVTLTMLDSVDALAVAPIFDDDLTQYEEALLAARKVVSLMDAGRITVLASCGGA